VDDAAISIAYGLTFFSGEGLRLTAFSQPVEAFSNPLWTFLTGFAVLFRADPIEFARLLGIALGALSLPFFALWGPASEGRKLQLQDAVAPVLAASCPNFAYWVASGMETGLLALVSALSGGLLFRQLRLGSGATCGLVLALICLTRPEGLLYAGAAAALWIVHRGLQRRWPGSQELRIAAYFIAVLGGYLLFRWAYFAALLPNSYFAKLGWDFHPGNYLLGFYRAHRWLVGVAALGAVVAWVGGVASGRFGLLAALYAGAVTYFSWRSKGDWMGEWRFLAPLVPFLAVALSAGGAGLRRLSARLVNGPRAMRFAGPATAVASLALAAVVSTKLLERRKAVQNNDQLPYRYIAGLFRPIEATLLRLDQRRPLVGFPDLGGLGMTLRNAEVIDVAGLADFAVARHARNYSAMEDYLVSEGLPAMVDGHGPSGHINSMRTLMANYTRFSGPVWVLRGLTATEDPRCPGGKASVVSASADALSHRIEAELASARPLEALRIWRCAFAYLPDENLPARSWRSSIADRADVAGEKRIADGQLESAVRHFSLATVIDGGSAHRRRKTERYRQELIPSPGSRLP
jgi:hypothetical protein